jgi:transcriptional regulator
MSRIWNTPPAQVMGHNLSLQKQTDIPMYIPKHFNETDLQKILNLIRQHAFGTLITSHNNIPMASHIPFLIEETQPFKLRGHLAYANEQWKHIQDDGSVMLIFQGPHTYISPRWYKNAGVPTWNYAMVHIYGKANILKAPDKLQNIVNGLTNEYEKYAESPWQPEYPEKMLSAIVGFEIEVEDIQAKFKLSQNKSMEDIQGVIEHLVLSDKESDIELVQLMRHQAKIR